MKMILKNLSLTFFSLVFTALCLEVFLRFIPVCQGFEYEAVHQNNPVFRSILERKVLQKSNGWDMKNPQLKQMNEAGFVNPNVYLAKKDRKINTMLAVVGDSYVEAIQVKDTDAFFSITGKNDNV